ncbi:hypothetical protein BV20DRAFT_935696 [Pilatotrama ljubarskyi]|nr:hypothetical protein BV20DRAFT_935696 [Pilatotrama ljubarskyi]
MYWLSIMRIAFLGWAVFCSLVLLGVGAHALSVLGGLNNLPTFAWAGLSVATGVLTLVTLPAMLVIDFLRSGAFSSMIVVELAWLGFLGVLFLATGGAAADSAATFWGNCGQWTPASAQTVCSETSAAAAFGFLAWLPLWGYTITLLVLLIIHANRGHYVWKSSVKEANFAAGLPPASTSAPGMNAYGSEVKPYEAASLNPGQVPYAYPPSATVSPAPTGYGQPAAPRPANAYPQV